MKTHSNQLFFFFSNIALATSARPDLRFLYAEVCQAATSVHEAAGSGLESYACFHSVLTWISMKLKCNTSYSRAYCGLATEVLPTPTAVELVKLYFRKLTEQDVRALIRIAERSEHEEMYRLEWTLDV